MPFIFKIYDVWFSLIENIISKPVEVSASKNLRKIKMNFDKTKTEISTIALILVLTISATLVTLPTISAHDPAWEIPSYSYLYVAPDPIGVGQSAYLVFWLDQPPPTAAGAGGDRWQNMEIEVTTPDGTTETLGPFTSDPVGGGWTMYTPVQVGTYSFEFNFPGQVVSLYGPKGVPGSPNPFIGDTFLPSSATATLEVQQDPIPDLRSYSLPTEYWTRPIEGQNTQWTYIASNWLSGSHIVGKVQPDGAAPNSAHIMWTKPLEYGGVVGGSRTGIDGVTFYDGTAYEGKFGNPIIMNGRLYYDIPLSGSRSGGGYVCVDLLTGEELWWKNTTAPSFAQLYDYESPNQHGVIPNGYLWSTVGSDWYAYDGLTGNWLFTLTNVPSGTQVYGPNGEILRYVLDSESKCLALWNNTAAHGLTAARDSADTTSSNYLQWRPLGKTVNASEAYSWNVSVPWLSTDAYVLKIVHDDFILGMNGSFPSVASLFSTGSSDPYTMWTMSLKPESRGDLLWMRTYDAPPGNITRETAPMWMQTYLDPEVDVFLKYDKQTIQWSGYSLEDGEQLWQASPEHDLNYYADVGLPRYTVAYGKLYSTGYSGIVYCYDLTDGSLLWEYSAPTGLASTYPNWPLGPGAVADGKLYLFTTEHSANAPHWQGVQMRCINATTGEEIWTVDGYGSQGAMAVADGYLVYLNSYDMQIYCVGKGPSETTVSGPATTIPLGEEVLITGSVIDLSTGTEQNEQAARFPNGVPAMSDASMSEWMEYVYMQKQMSQNATGVEVVITTVDPNGNTYELGTATSTTTGTYGCTFEPPVPGLYRIIATFEGSDSYYGSCAETYVNVGEAPIAAQPMEPDLAAPTPSQPEPTATELTAPELTTPEPTELETAEPTQAVEAPLVTTEIAIIAVVAVACVICTVAFWALRKRK